jgi:hydrogenase/urease accessory protein HupE
VTRRRIICRRRARSALALAVLLVAGLHAPPDARAHEIRPALLDLVESADGWVDVTWKVPTRGDRALGLTPMLPAALVAVGPPSERRVPGAVIQRSRHRSDGVSLVGERIVIDGLSGTQTDVLLRVVLADGSEHSAILRPESPAYEIPARATKWQVAKSYWRMGVEHILSGVDHLLFLLALLLIVSGFGKLVQTVTAFTLAHSVTLALATLGFVHVPPAPTEAVIALSILFLAAEIVRKQAGEVGLTERKPWLVALAFGLFHGLGFAGALSQVGIPAHEVPLALLMFNVGVETGQLVFVVAVAAVLAALRHLPVSVPAGAWRLAPYTIGAIAAFWTIQRVVISVSGEA